MSEGGKYNQLAFDFDISCKVQNRLKFSKGNQFINIGFIKS